MTETTERGMCWRQLVGAVLAFPLLCRRAAGFRGPRAAVCVTADVAHKFVASYLGGLIINAAGGWKTTPTCIYVEHLSA